MLITFLGEAGAELLFKVSGCIGRGDPRREHTRAGIRPRVVELNCSELRSVVCVACCARELRRDGHPALPGCEQERAHLAEFLSLSPGLGT